MSTPPDMGDLVPHAGDAGFAVLARRIRIAPFHQWLALELDSASPEEVVISARWRDEMRSRLDPPIMHGGIVASLLDLAGLYAVLAGGRVVKSTAYLHIDYHKPVPPGDVRVRARTLRLGRTISVSEAFISGPAGEPLASSRGGYVA